MGSRSDRCECYLEHLDIDEMCEPCRERHLDKMIDRNELIHESARDEVIFNTFIENHPGIFAEV